MTAIPTPEEHRERIIAALLRYGTWLASALVAAGMLAGTLRTPDHSLLFGLGGYDLAKAGVALFILLPVSRVALMLMLFLRERDGLYTAISALVLAIIAAGVLVQF